MLIVHEWRRETRIDEFENEAILHSQFRDAAGSPIVKIYKVSRWGSRDHPNYQRQAAVGSAFAFPGEGSVPPALPLTIVRPILLVVDFEVAARVPPDIVVRLRNGSWEVPRQKAQ